MTDWLPGIDRDDVVRIDLVGVTLGGIRGGVERAVLDLHLRDGRIVRTEKDFQGMAYGAAADTIEQFNRVRRASWPDRRGDTLS